MTVFSNLWVNKWVELHSGKVKVYTKMTSIQPAVELELTLRSHNKFTEKEAKGFVEILTTEVISAGTTEELADAIMPKMKQKWPGYGAKFRTKLLAAVLWCLPENTSDARAMTTDPIPNILDSGRPNLNHELVPREAVGYILGRNHDTLRGMQNRNGATCYLDDRELIRHERMRWNTYRIIRIWGELDAVKKLGEEIRESTKRYSPY